MKILLFTLLTATLPGSNAPQNAESQLRGVLDQLTHNQIYQIHAAHLDGRTLHGDLTLYEQRVQFAGALNAQNGLESVEFTFPAGSELGISHGAWQRLAGKKLATYVPEELETLLQLQQLRVELNDERSVEQLDLQFRGLREWAVLSGDWMSLREIATVFHIQHPNDAQQRRVQGTLTGKTELASTRFDVSAELHPEREKFALIATTKTALPFSSTLQKLAGRDAVFGVEIPTYAVDFSLDRAQLTLRPYARTASLHGTTNWGTVDADFLRTEGKKPKTEYVAVLTVGKDAKLSKLHSSLSLLDPIPLGGQRIVLTSKEKPKGKKSKASFPSVADIKSGLKRGCQMVANIDLQELGMAALLKIQQLEVTTLLNNSLQGVVLTGDLDTNLPVGPTTELSGVQFRLTPAPNQFAVALVGQMDVDVDEQQLAFGGGMEVGVADQSLNLLASSEREWDAPFGVNGLVVRNMQLQFGASFTTAPVILPQIGVSGDLDIGEVVGGATLVFDTRNPQRSMIDARFNRLNFGEIYQTIIPNSIRRKTPKSVVNTLKKLELQDVIFKLVPFDMTVMDEFHQAGFTMGGALEINGWRGSALVDLDPKSGFAINGTMDPIKMSVLKIEGGNGRAKPVLDIAVRKGQTPKLLVSGKATVLGIGAETDVELLENGISFMVGGKVFNLFAANVKVRGNNLHRAEDLQVEVNMKQDLLAYLTSGLANAIEESTAKSVQRIGEFQSAIKKAEAEVKSWDRQIAKLRRDIEKDMAGDRKKIADARSKVNAAQREVNRLRGAIKSKELELKKTPKHRLPTRAKIRAELGTLHTALFSANRGLDAARLFLKGLDYLNINPDLDPKMISARAAQKKCQLALAGAREGLGLYKKTLKNGGKLASFVLEEGVAKAVDIKEVSFKGKLGAVHGGKVDLKVKTIWMGKIKTVNFKFDFYDTAQGVVDLLKSLRDFKRGHS